MPGPSGVVYIVFGVGYWINRGLKSGLLQEYLQMHRSPFRGGICQTVKEDESEMTF